MTQRATIKLYDLEPPRGVPFYDTDPFGDRVLASPCGCGIRVCLGQQLARLEGEAVLSALARRAEATRLTAESVRRLNDKMRSLQSLPMAIVPARNGH